jgi:hypothetical protein
MWAHFWPALILGAFALGRRRPSKRASYRVRRSGRSQCTEMVRCFGPRKDLQRSPVSKRVAPEKLLRTDASEAITP